MSETKVEFQTACRRFFVIAACDFILATVCAVNGSIYFVAFMVLAGLMYGMGLYLKAKTENLQGE